MKRLGLVLAGLALAGAVNTADAQLTMQMSNGWNFTFAGNVNAFFVFSSQGSDGDLDGSAPGAPVGLTGVGRDGTFFGTGLLPAFATFEAKGKEGNTDLGVHFGFAPEVQCGSAAGGGVHDCFGSQIDMRQVYLTVGGSWGQILMGKELGLFNRQNILQDQTLFGVGATGIQTGGTTLGRIGYGYIYPNFVGQLTYSTVAGKPLQFAVGLFDPSAINLIDAVYGAAYSETILPRLEAEVTYKTDGGSLFWANGTVQNAKDPVDGGLGSKTAVGLGGGIKFAGKKFSLVGTGYWGSGIGTTLQFSGAGPGAQGYGVAFDGSGDLRTSYGYYFQGSVTPGKSTVAASYGASAIKGTDGEGGGTITNSVVVVGLYHQLTKSLKWVIEGGYQWSSLGDLPTGFPDVNSNTQFNISTGLMLFF
jgi:hypothetical protein